MKVFWSHRYNNKDQSELVKAIAVELGPGEPMLFQETTYVLDSDKVKRCLGNQGYNSEDIEQCRSIFPVSVDMPFLPG